MIRRDALKAALARGLMCYPGGRTIDGRRGDHVLLAPPFIPTRDDLREIARRLAAALQDVVKAVGAAAQPG